MVVSLVAKRWAILVRISIPNGDSVVDVQRSLIRKRRVSHHQQRSGKWCWPMGRSILRQRYGRFPKMYTALTIDSLLGDSTWRNTTVSVNGGANVLVDQPNTGGGHVVLSVPVKLNLRSGANTLTFSNGQSSESFRSYNAKPQSFLMRMTCACRLRR